MFQLIFNYQLPHDPSLATSLDELNSHKNMRSSYSSSDLSTQLNSITAVNELQGNPKADSSNLSSNSVNQLSAQSHLSSTIVNSSSNNSFNKLEMPNIGLNKTKVDFGKIAEGCRDATKFFVTLTNPGILSQQTVSGASLLIELDDCSEWVVHRHGKTSQTDSLSKYDELKLQLAKSLSLNANRQLKYEQVITTSITTLITNITSTLTTTITGIIYFRRASMI